MAVLEQNPIASSVANGVTTVFPHAFKVLAADDLQVRGVLGTTYTTYVLGVDYTVSGLGSDSGAVQFLSAPASGTTITRTRRTRRQRLTDYQENGDLPASTLNADLDRLVLMAQEAAAAAQTPDTPVDTLRFDLANNSSGDKGAGQIGFGAAVVYAAGTVGAFLRSLATATGATVIGFLQAGANAVVRTVRDKLRETVTPQDFGAVGDGVADDTAALVRLAAYVNAFSLLARPITIRMPSGVYRYTSTWAFTRPVHIDADLGAMLNYQGTGYALQLGPNGISNFDVFLQGEYSVNNLRFTGGANASHGIYMNEYVLEPRLMGLTFEDFGNASSIDIFSQFENWNIIIQNCRKLTFSSLTAVGNFIRIEGRNRANTAYDGGNSRVSIVDCWMTSYSNQEMGYFAYINCVKGLIRGGGFQVSRGGIVLGPLASGSVIDSVYSEISTTSQPWYITVLSAAAGGGNYHQAQQVSVKNGYVNMHEEVAGVGNLGRLVKAGDANVRLIGWDIENLSITQFRNGQPLIEQNDLSGQTNNRIRNVRPLFIPAASDNTWRFVTRAAGYAAAEEWYEANLEDGLSLGTPGRANFLGTRARLNINPTLTNNDAAIALGGIGDGISMGIVSKCRPGYSNAGWHFRTYNDSGTAIGGVYSSGSTTSFATSSDYRLKTDIKPFAGALAVLDQLRPVTYTWRDDGKPGAGFIAHELANVLPHCVLGQKDAVDDEGQIRPQSVDLAAVVPVLVAAVQELRAELRAAKGAA